MKRRNFIRTSGFVLATTLLFGASARAKVARFRPVEGNRRLAFRWGVASGDPQSDAVMLWTKLVPLKAQADERLVLQLSRDEGFLSVELERQLTARARSDHTLRVFVDRLKADTTYYYRFIAADGAVSRTGRTWTAPSPETSRPVVIALASCQTYPASQYGAYRHLIARERETGERPDFILHVGDYVYGTSKSLPLDPDTGLSGPDPEAGPQGRPQQAADNVQSPEIRGERARRNPTADPAAGLFDYAKALSATRALYDKYHLDRDLQDARARYPFVAIWDDHEFGNDVWQSFSGEASNPVGRMASLQAWSEWVPQILTQNKSIPHVPNQARDFERKPVRTEQIAHFDDNFLAQNKQNLAAISAITGYRAIRWGKLVDLIVTDNRSYRGPGANPAISLESIATNNASDGIFTGFTLFEADVLQTLAEGRFANGGNPPKTITVKGQVIPNPRLDAPRVSLLGARQKAWFKDALSKSEARWKVWANAEPITGFNWDVGKVKPEVGSGFNWLDSWDGFPNERKELLQYIRRNKISNVVSLSGDRHAQFAALVGDDYALPNPDYVIPEYVCTGISAFARATNLTNIFRRLGIGEYARAQVGGQGRPVCTLDSTLTFGVEGTKALLAGEDQAKLATFAANGPNPGIHHSDMDSHGYLVARFSEDSMRVEFVTMPAKTWDPGKQPNGPDPLRRTVFKTPVWDPLEEPLIQFVGQSGERTRGRFG